MIAGKRLYGVAIALMLVALPAYVQAAPVDAAYVISMERSLPADPGEACKASLVGIDSNNNGIRDDIERWVAVSFQGRPISRAAAIQLAVAMQKVMATGGDVDELTAIALKKQIRDGLECLLATVDEADQKKIFGDLQWMIVNTPERSAVIAKLEEEYPEPEGTIISNPSIAACTIQPEQLINKE